MLLGAGCNLQRFRQRWGSRKNRPRYSAQMELDNKNRVVVVTGASSGIGRAIVERFATEGAFVLAHAHTGHDAMAAWAAPLGVATIAADLSTPEGAHTVIEEAVRRFGRVDVAIANAGRWPEPDLRLDETTVASLQQTLADNLWTALFTARAFFAALARNGPAPGGASLVFTGSTAGRFGEKGHAAYATAKSALHGLVATLKNEIVELDPFGRVNGVQPGWTVTPTVARHVTPELVERVTATMPLRQLADPRDVAAAVVFLATPATARHVTGEWITVAGGMEGRMVHR